MDLARVSAFVLDVGSTITSKKTKKSSFGWARATTAGVHGNHAIDDCCFAIQEDVKLGRHVAVGFESPLFIPAANDASLLSKGRDGERDRSCFAPAGGYVATLGLHQALHLLKGMSGHKVSLRWEDWHRDPTPVLLWEAFVSGTAHTTTANHVADAATAAIEFLKRVAAPKLTTDVTVHQPREVFSMMGAAVLWAGLDVDLCLLREPALVIKPTTPCSAPVTLFARPSPA